MHEIIPKLSALFAVENLIKYAGKEGNHPLDDTVFILRKKQNVLCNGKDRIIVQTLIRHGDIFCTP